VTMMNVLGHPAARLERQLRAVDRTAVVRTRGLPRKHFTRHERLRYASAGRDDPVMRGHSLCLLLAYDSLVVADRNDPAAQPTSTKSTQPGGSGSAVHPRFHERGRRLVPETVAVADEVHLIEIAGFGGYV
jgi:hypothetical protein